MANELQGAISRLLALWRTYTSGVSFAGVVTYVSAFFYSETRDGILNLVADFFKLLELNRTYSSALDLAGSFTRYLVSERLREGVLSTAGAFTRLISTWRSSASSISFSGALSYVSYEFSPLVQGLISFAGRVWQETPLYGFVYRLLGLYRTKTAELTFSGAISYIESMVSEGVYAGIVTTAGSISRYFIKNITKAGTQAYSGTVSKLLELLRTSTGTLTTTGRAIRTNAQVSHLYDGALSFGGEVYRGLYLTYSSTLDFAGSVSASAKEAMYQAVGVLSTAAEITRASILARAKDGILTLDGLVSGIKSSGVVSHWVSVAGSITPSATLDGVRNLVTIIVSGALTPIGRITLIDAVLDRISEAGLVISGSLSYVVVTARNILSGELTLSGLLSALKWFKRSGVGVVSFAGEVVSYTTGGLWNYSAEGVASFAGVLTKLYEPLRTYVGSITPSGILSKVLDMGRTVTGAISFAGQALGAFVSRDWNLGYLTLSGAVTPYLVTYRPTYSSSLSCTGVVTRLLSVARIATGSETLSAANPGRYKDILYFGPPNP